MSAHTLAIATAIWSLALMLGIVALLLFLAIGAGAITLKRFERLTRFAKLFATSSED